MTTLRDDGRRSPGELPAGPTPSTDATPLRTLLAIGTGFTLLTVGAILLLPLTEVAVPALAAGLRLLSRHYVWAKAADDKLDRVVRAARQRWRQLPRPARITIPTALAAGVALVIYVQAT